MGSGLLRRYNSILLIPYQLERLLFYGLLVCLDSFLVRALSRLFSCAQQLMSTMHSLALQMTLP